MRYLAATELLYVMYIGSVARNRMSKKLERLLSVMLLPIFKPLDGATNHNYREIFINIRSVNGNNAAEGIQRYNLETSIV